MFSVLPGWKILIVAAGIAIPYGLFGSDSAPSTLTKRHAGQIGGWIAPLLDSLLAYPTLPIERHA